MSDPLFINAAAGAPEYDARELRRGFAVDLFPGVSDRFGARQGVRPGHAPASLSGTTWTVHDLLAVVYPGLTASAGPYRVQHPGESGALDPPDGSNPRIDALDLQVQDDDEDALGERRARVVYTVGTASTTPEPPAVVASSLRLATVSVPAEGQGSPTMTVVARWTVAAGGVLPVRTAAELPTAGMFDGMMAWDQDLQRLVARVGGSWEDLAVPGLPATATDVEVLDELFLTGTGATSGPFANIPQNHRHLAILWHGFHSGASSFVSLAMRFNGDGSTNAYSSQRLFTENGLLEIGSGTTGFTVMRVGVVGSGPRGGGIIMIGGYSASPASKSAVGYGMAHAAGEASVHLAGGRWDNSSQQADPITRIDLWPSGELWAAGARLTLLGIGRP